MRWTRLGLDNNEKKTVVILGAGASRGASFVDDDTELAPPLDRDFFQQLSRMLARADRTIPGPSPDPGGNLLAFVRSHYGDETNLSMEAFFSETDSAHRLRTAPFRIIKHGNPEEGYWLALRNFYLVLGHMLNLTTSRACEYHELLAGLLSTQDAVISFNYDCLMDRALRDKAGEKWRPEVGYGTTVTNGASSWTTHVGGEPVDQSIRLLKMHGSMNWLRKDQSLELIPDPTTVIQTNSIIPPTWCKDDLATSLFGDIWRAAGRSLREAQVMVAVGYSLPDIDVHSRSLLRAEAGYKREDGTPFKLLVLVNKDAQARRRFREIMRNGLAFSTPVLEYPTLADLAQVLKPQESP